MIFHQIRTIDFQFAKKQNIKVHYFQKQAFGHGCSEGVLFKFGQSQPIPVILRSLPSFFVLKEPFNPHVGHEPHQRHERIKHLGHQGQDKRAKDGKGIDPKRDLPFEVAADRPGKDGILPVPVEDETNQDIIGNSSHQEHHPIQCNGWTCKTVLAHPCCCKWDQGKPEKEVQVCP